MTEAARATARAVGERTERTDPRGARRVRGAHGGGGGRARRRRGAKRERGTTSRPPSSRGSTPPWRRSPRASPGAAPNERRRGQPRIRACAAVGPLRQASRRARMAAHRARPRAPRAARRGARIGAVASGWGASERTARRTKSNACCAAIGAISSPKWRPGCPKTWQAAVRWCAMLVDLPVLQHLARGGAVPPWMRDDPIYRDLASASRRDSAPCRARRTAAGAARRGVGRPRPHRRGCGWREWRRRHPGIAARGRRGHRRSQLARSARISRRFATARCATARRCAARCRRGLSLLFRRAIIDPSAAFIFLALSALDLERLRGELLRRVVVSRHAAARRMIRPQARPLVRDSRRARRRDAGARGAGDDGRSRARGAPERRAAGGARRPASAAVGVRGAVARATTPTGRRCTKSGVAVSRAAGGHARAQSRAPARMGRGCRAGDPAAPARRGGARRASAVAPRAGDDRRIRHRLRAPGRRGPDTARAAVRVSARQRARASARHARAQRRSRRDDGLRARRARRSATRTTSQALAQQAALLKGRVYDAPAWLRVDAEETERYIAPRLDALAREEQRLRSELEALHAQHDLATALSDANRLQWVIRNVRALESGDLFCWITGWTSDFSGARARRRACALRRAGAAALPAARPEGPGAAAARQPALGAAVRDLQPRARHAVAQRGGSVACCSRSPCR